MFKIFNHLFFVLFIVCAFLQYNDPDPYIWMPIYLFSAIMCWFAARNKYFPRIYLAAISVFGLYALYLFFTDDGVKDWIFEHQAEDIAASMKAEAPWIEDTREFFGLCIIMFVLALNYFVLRSSERKKNYQKLPR